MRKTSTYARKLRAKGGPVHTFNGAEWMNTINRVRSNSEAPPHMSSPAQMTKATQERIAVLLNMRKAA